MMKSLHEELGETYTLAKDDMFYPNLVIDNTGHRPISKWGRMHEAYLRKEHPDMYKQLILNGRLHKHLADANERANRMLEQLIEQMKSREDITEKLKAEQPMVWVSKMNSLRFQSEEIVCTEVVNIL